MRARDIERLQRRQAKAADQELSALAGVFYDAVLAAIDGKTPEEKQRLVDACARLTKTNCWFVTYHAGPFVGMLVRNDLVWQTHAFERFLTAVCPRPSDLTDREPHAHHQ